jgi:hypothetical protein
MNSVVSRVRQLYLLEHLVDVCENDAVKVTVLVHGEQVAERSLGHLLDSVLDGNKLVIHELVILGQIRQSCDDLASIIVAA